jgi:hypothetical protein
MFMHEVTDLLLPTDPCVLFFYDGSSVDPCEAFSHIYKSLTKQLLGQYPSALSLAAIPVIGVDYALIDIIAQDYIVRYARYCVSQRSSSAKRLTLTYALEVLVRLGYIDSYYLSSTGPINITMSTSREFLLQVPDSEPCTVPEHLQILYGAYE